MAPRRSRIRTNPKQPPPPTMAALRLGNLLKLRRLEAKLSQEELAAKIGTHRNTVWRFENGEPLTVDLFFKVCAAVNVPAHSMIRAMQRAILEESREQ